MLGVSFVVRSLRRKVVGQFECGRPISAMNRSGSFGVIARNLIHPRFSMSTTRITIEPGPGPLYVVLVSAGRMIWQFDGAVDRVVKAVLVTNAGVQVATRGVATGLAPDVVTLVARSDCMKAFVEQPSIDAARAVSEVRRRAGQTPATVVAVEIARHIWMPSGRFEGSTETPRGMKVMTLRRSARPAAPPAAANQSERNRAGPDGDP